MQSALFDLSAYPPGLAYRPDFINADEERTLVAAIQQLPFSTVEMRGQVARRRTAHFGVTYAYGERRADPGPPFPSFLLDVRAAAAAWAGIPAEQFAEALVTEYVMGAAIGWHRDAPTFGDTIAGVSLLGRCRLKFRPYVPPRVLAAGTAGVRRTTHELELPPRSGYLITGPARHDFEHSIPATPALRYSVTFRTVRSARS